MRNKIKVLIFYCLLLLFIPSVVVGLTLNITPEELQELTNEERFGEITSGYWNARLGTYLEPANILGYGLLVKGSNRYVNFGSIYGSAGYGFRDDSGTLKWKNSSGSWAEFGVGGGIGTVTSVAMTVPTGLSISGSPITNSGTLALTYSSGYEGMLSANSTNWNSFYNTPSGRITAGTNLTWSTNTLNVDDPFSVANLTVTDTATTSKLIVSTKNIGDYLDFFNGTFIESFNATTTSDGSTITMTLANSANYTSGLTMSFSSGDVSLATPTSTPLTAGSDASPTENFVYITEANQFIEVSTSGWPSNVEHNRIAYFNCPSAGFVQTNNGCYINQNWNDDVVDENNQGDQVHISERLRREQARYFSGVDGNGTDNYLTPTGGNVEFKSTSGIIYQKHAQTFSAFDTSIGDMVLVKNWNGDAFHDITNLYAITRDSASSTIGNNKYFNLVIWGVANKTGQFTPIMINLPGGSYNSQSEAENDTSGFDDLTIPDEFKNESSTGFLIARITIQMKTGGGTWVVASTVDLRGLTPQSATGGTAAGTLVNFPDNTFTIFDETDITKIINFSVGGITTGNTRTLTIQDADGTLAYVNNQTFTGLTQFSNASTTQLTVGIVYDSNNSPGGSGEILSSTVTGTDWVTGGAGLWTDAGDYTYLTATTDDVVIGSDATSTAKLWVDVSASTTYVGNLTSTDDSVYDLGTSTAFWANAYIDKVNFTSTAHITGGTTFYFRNGSYYLGINLGASTPFLFSGASEISFNDTVRPFSDSIKDLGNSTKFWDETFTDELVLQQGTMGATAADQVRLAGLDLSAGDSGLHIKTENDTEHLFASLVGISTTTPAFTLDVNGDFRVGEVGNADVLTINAGTGIITSTGVWDLGGAISFELPNGASPTVNEVAEIAWDITSGNLIIATSTNATSVVLASATSTLYMFTVASTSPELLSGSFEPMPPNPLPQVITGVICYVLNGTSQVFNLSDAGGTNDTNTITCTTSITQYAFTTNNVWNAYEEIRMEYGTRTGETDKVIFTILGYRKTD